MLVVSLNQGSFFHTRISHHLSTICWRDCLFSIELPLPLCLSSFALLYIFYKELSHTIMELAGWKSAVWVSRLETQQSWWCDEVGYWTGIPVELFQILERPVFLSYSGFLLIGWGPPALWRAICFTQSTLIQMSVSTKTPSKLIYKINHHSFQRSVVYWKF